MPWFFKDPIVTVTWLNLDHAQLNSKKWPNMIKLPQMNFFLEKQLIKYSCTYVSFCKIFKKILEPIQVMRMCHFWAQSGPFLLNKIFLVQTIIITFIYLLALFIVQNFQKTLRANPESWGCAIFGPKMAHLPKKEFFRKTCS